MQRPLPIRNPRERAGRLQRRSRNPFAAWRPALALPLWLVALSAPCLGQGDTCATAAPIAGTGSFAFDSTNASTEPNACPRANHVYWEWTASAPGHYEFTQEHPSGTIFLDSALGVYSSAGCDPANLLRCENNFGFGVPVSLPNVQVGDRFWLELGETNAGSVSGPGGTGLLVIQLAPCDPANLMDDAWEENDTPNTAAPLGLGTYLNLVVSDQDPDYYQVTLAPHQGLNVTVTHPLNDRVAIEIRQSDGTLIRDELSGTSATTASSEFDPQSAQPRTLIVGVLGDPPIGVSECFSYSLDLVATVSNPRFASYCYPAPNGAGRTTEIFGIEEVTPQGTAVHLTAHQASGGQVAYFIAGSQALDPGVPIGFLPGLNLPTGFLCLQGPFARLNVSGTPWNSVGTAFDEYVNLAGTGGSNPNRYTLPPDLPAPFGPILAGETWHFQLWYRSTQGYSRMSHGLSVSF